MGTLFPDGPEHPDHESIPRGPQLEPKDVKTVVVSGLLAVSFAELLPWADAQPDPPQQEYH
jgi:hypothetical protein